jgi:hypothetical protein
VAGYLPLLFYAAAMLHEFRRELAELIVSNRKAGSGFRPFCFVAGGHLCLVTTSTLPVVETLF